ncbi:MAG: hypothetical protein K9J37_14670 [Saprospiraceae bacterium]|nr:hypothetical protein [Saprospiraceae bacterium]MCF8251151.1 hypothetical protein [Saprospiraceae bacterium]MCF8281874.1 hypothetical protein [Bacteroidales bacterium]MCF8312963.1 hypothetical protein [Saprospiraceae bacterium]MCF8441410.1 hypothetical protein [Saprospiraceae bacterium]
MKLNTELIEYYLASGELREQLDWIWEKQGLYRKPSADELEMLSLAEKPPGLTLDGLNQRILDEMPAWEASLQPLLVFSGLTAETLAQLQSNEKWQIFKNLQASFAQ